MHNQAQARNTIHPASQIGEIFKVQRIHPIEIPGCCPWQRGGRALQGQQAALALSILEGSHELPVVERAAADRTVEAGYDEPMHGCCPP